MLLSLVTSGHLLWLFAAWHAVTWLLTTLLSFNDASPAARRAGRTTLRVQGIGDAALLCGILLLYQAFGTFDIPALFQTLKAGAVPMFGAGLGGRLTW